MPLEARIWRFKRALRYQAKSLLNKFEKGVKWANLRKGQSMNKTTKINILAYASEPDKEYNYDGDIVEYKGKRYFVSLAEERVEFIGVVVKENSDER